MRLAAPIPAILALAVLCSSGIRCSTIGLSETDDDISWTDDDDDGSPDDDASDDDGGPDDDDDTWTPGVDVGGDTCEDATDLGALIDDGVGMTLHEDCSEKGDVDWYTFVADDDLAQDLAEGGDRWGVRIRFTRNDDDWFRFLVFRHGCLEEDCPDLGGYDEYEYILDQDPCGDLPLPDCLDDTTAIWIKVFPAQGPSGNREYELYLVNG